MYTPQGAQANPFKKSGQFAKTLKKFTNSIFTFKTFFLNKIKKCVHCYTYSTIVDSTNCKKLCYICNTQSSHHHCHHRCHNMLPTLLCYQRHNHLYPTLLHSSSQPLQLLVTYQVTLLLSLQSQILLLTFYWTMTYKM